MNKPSHVPARNILHRTEATDPPAAHRSPNAPHQALQLTSWSKKETNIVQKICLQSCPMRKLGAGSPSDHACSIDVACVFPKTNV